MDIHLRLMVDRVSDQGTDNCQSSSKQSAVGNSSSTFRASELPAFLFVKLSPSAILFPLDNARLRGMTIVRSRRYDNWSLSKLKDERFRVGDRVVGKAGQIMGNGGLAQGFTPRRFTAESSYEDERL